MNQYKNNLWFIKLQVNQLAFCRSPADYIILGFNRYLVECKEVDCRKNKKAFTISRVTQRDSLEYFDSKHINNISYLLIFFRFKRLAESYFYMIPIDEYILYEEKLEKKSININNFEANFNEWKVKVLKGGLLELHPFIY